MTFSPQKLGLTKVFYQTVGLPPMKWIHNDSMYIRFVGIRNTKIWSKSTLQLAIEWE